jgi:hypothetical protein
VVLYVKGVQKYLIKNKFWNKSQRFIADKCKVKQLVKSKYFEIFFMIVILANLVVVILSYMELSEDQNTVLDEIDRIIVYVFLAEAVLKLLGLGIKNYFNDTWNKYFNID